MKKNKIISKQKFFIYISIIVIVLSIISFMVIKDNDNKQRNKLLGDAFIISSVINVDEIQNLAGNKYDLVTPVYQNLKKQFFNIRTSNDSYKFLYLLGMEKDKNTVFFFLDSQMPNSPDYVPPGEIYSEVPDEYITVFKTKKKMTVGPVTDRWGTVITALIPIIDKKSGDIIAILGLDTIDNKWNKTIYAQSLPKIGFIVVVILAVIILFLFKRKSIKEIKHRETYLMALNKISDISFKTIAITDLQSFVDIIGKVANASRTYIFKNHRNENNELLLSQMAEYVGEDIKPEIDNPDLQNINYNDWIPRWEKLLRNGEIVKGRVADFPEKERQILEPQEIISLIVMPIFVEKTFWGLIGFDNCSNNSEWNDNDIKYLKIATKRLEHSIELVEKQKLLEADNKRFKITMDAMNNGIYVADMQSYEILFMNKYFIDLFGDGTGKKCYKVLQGLDEPCSFCTNNKILDEKGLPKEVQLWEFQNRITKRWYHLRDQAIRWSDGQMVRMEVAVDITNRKKSDEQIRILSKVVKTTTQSVIITDLSGNINFVNEALLKSSGFDNENELIGKSMYTFTNEKGIIKLKEEILPNIFNKGYYSGELHFVKKNNTIFPGLSFGKISQKKHFQSRK